MYMHRKHLRQCMLPMMVYWLIVVMYTERKQPLQWIRGNKAAWKQPIWVMYSPRKHTNQWMLQLMIYQLIPVMYNNRKHTVQWIRGTRAIWIQCIQYSQWWLYSLLPILVASFAMMMRMCCWLLLIVVDCCCHDWLYLYTTAIMYVWSQILDVPGTSKIESFKKKLGMTTTINLILLSTSSSVGYPSLSYDAKYGSTLCFISSALGNRIL